MGQEEWISLAIVLITFAAITFSIVVAPFLISLEVLKLEPSKKKSLWLLAILVAWPLGSFAYAFFGSKNRKHALSVVGSLLISAISIFSLSQMIQSAYELGAKDIDWLKRHVSSRFDHDISESERQSVLSDLDTLKDELINDTWYLVDDKLAIINLVKILSDMIEDDRLNRQEFDYWIEQFLQRKGLSKRAYEEYVGKKNHLNQPG